MVQPWEALPWLEGLVGHSYNSLVHVEALFRRLKKEEDARLIVTGDVTSKGHPEEFRYASKFLASQLVPPQGNYLGLHCPEWKDRAVPGNHDHWPGEPIIGPPSPELWRTFRRCHFISDPIPLPTGHLLRFSGIDTDSDVPFFGGQRLCARGAFLPELKRLNDDLPPPEPEEIRVLLMHHSATYKGFFLEMNAASRSALIDFAASKGFYLLLCGHTHMPRIERLTLPLSAPPALHACCGASSIMTTLPLELTNLGRRRSPNWIPNSVLLHRLTKENGGLRWSVQAWFETSHGFQVLPDVSPQTTSGSMFFPSGSGRPDIKKL